MKKVQITVALQLVYVLKIGPSSQEVNVKNILSVIGVLIGISGAQVATASQVGCGTTVQFALVQHHSKTYNIAPELVQVVDLKFGRTTNVANQAIGVAQASVQSKGHMMPVVRYQIVVRHVGLGACAVQNITKL